jgi:hypothetical protein
MIQLAANGALAHEGVGLAILVGLLLIGALVVLVLRTRALPVCWNCGFRSVRRSHSHHHALDRCARICFLYPRRCPRCLRRFYCFQFHNVVRHSRHPMAAGKS